MFYKTMIIYLKFYVIFNFCIKLMLYICSILIQWFVRKITYLNCLAWYKWIKNQSTYMMWTVQWIVQCVKLGVFQLRYEVYLHAAMKLSFLFLTVMRICLFWENGSLFSTYMACMSKLIYRDNNKSVHEILSFI